MIYIAYFETYDDRGNLFIERIVHVGTSEQEAKDALLPRIRYKSERGVIERWSSAGSDTPEDRMEFRVEEEKKFVLVPIISLEEASDE